MNELVQQFVEVAIVEAAKDFAFGRRDPVERAARSITLALRLNTEDEFRSPKSPLCHSCRGGSPLHLYRENGALSQDTIKHINRLFELGARKGAGCIKKVSVSEPRLTQPLDCPSVAATYDAELKARHCDAPTGFELGHDSPLRVTRVRSHQQPGASRAGEAHAARAPVHRAGRCRFPQMTNQDNRDLQSFGERSQRLGNAPNRQVRAQVHAEERGDRRM